MRVRFRVDGVLDRGGAGAEADDRRRRQPREDHERHGHRREAGAAGRARLGERRGPQGRPAYHHPADAARRGLHDPDPRQGAGAADPRRARAGGRASPALRGVLPQAVRGDPRHRPDRLGQVDVALRDAERDQRRRAQHHHDRGPGRVPARRHQPDRRQPSRRPDLRRRPALDPPRRPRRDHGRRDPRRRDRPDRHRVRAHRAPGADHAAHERRPGRDRPPPEDGDRELPDRLGGRLRRRPAPGAKALLALQEADGRAAGGADRGGLPRRRRPRGLRARRLRALLRLRLPRPHRPLLGDGDERPDQGDDGRRRARGRAHRGRPRGGHADPARGRPARRSAAGVTSIEEVARVSR